MAAIFNVKKETFGPAAARRGIAFGIVKANWQAAADGDAALFMGAKREFWKAPQRSFVSSIPTCVGSWERDGERDVPPLPAVASSSSASGVCGISTSSLLL